MRDLIIDHSTTDPGSSILSEQRLRDRLDAELKTKIDNLLATRGVTDLSDPGQVKVRIDLKEPMFRLDLTTGRPEMVFTGNPIFKAGDRIEKEKVGGGSGPGNGPGGESEDDFVFEVSGNEIEKHVLKGLQLPNMEKKTLLRRTIQTIERAGYKPFGPPATLDLLRSSGCAIGRRKALHRPSLEELASLDDEISNLESEPDSESIRQAAAALTTERERLRRKRRSIPYFDPMDLKFRRTDIVNEPVTAAVIFALMDVSASMTQKQKDLAKRFYWLLRFFLKQEYREVEIRYIRHTDVAQEVNEKEFFFGTKSGGTVVVSALEKMLQIIKQDYPLEQWNIYGCQAGDGDAGSDDALESAALVETEILPIVQHFAYLECFERSPKGETPLWQAYGTIKKPSHFAMKKVSDVSEIWPVFKSLFTSDDKGRRSAAA
ncbi:MAG: YeaH/YhbH family protein [Candidatus Pacebacteria bacterium]|nr:YeaH/YhbH family protein [Candidatus Paceibacterota bacterium]